MIVSEIGCLVPPDRGGRATVMQHDDGRPFAFIGVSHCERLVLKGFHENSSVDSTIADSTNVPELCTQESIIVNWGLHGNVLIFGTARISAPAAVVNTSVDFPRCRPILNPR